MSYLGYQYDLCAFPDKVNDLSHYSEYLARIDVVKMCFGATTTYTLIADREGDRL